MRLFLELTHTHTHTGRAGRVVVVGWGKDKGWDTPIRQDSCGELVQKSHGH